MGSLDEVTHASFLLCFGAAINSAGPALVLWRPSRQHLDDYLPMLLAMGVGSLLGAPLGRRLVATCPSHLHRGLALCGMLCAACCSLLCFFNGPLAAAALYGGLGLAFDVANCTLNALLSWRSLDVRGPPSFLSRLLPVAFAVGAACAPLILCGLRDFGFLVIAGASLVPATLVLLLPEPCPPLARLTRNTSSASAVGSSSARSISGAGRNTWGGGFPSSTPSTPGGTLGRSTEGALPASAHDAAAPPPPRNGAATAGTAGGSGGGGGGRGRGGRRAGGAVVFAVFLFVALGVGTQVAVGVWLGSYVRQVWSVSLGAASPHVATSLYWCGFALGRLLLGPGGALVAAFPLPASRLLATTPLSVFGLLLLLLAGRTLPAGWPALFGSWALWAGAAAAGVGVSGGFANGLAMLERRGGVSGRVEALMCLGGATGATLVPVLAGLPLAVAALETRYGLAAAFVLLAVFAFTSLLALLLVVAAGRQQSRRSRGRPSWARSSWTTGLQRDGSADSTAAGGPSAAQQAAEPLMPGRD